MAALWRAQVSGGAAIWAPVNGPGTPSTPTIGTITPTADGCVFTHSGGGTHYRIFVLAGSPGAWVSLPASPVTITGLTANTEFTLQLSGDGSTVADAEDWGTLNPGVGGGGVAWAIEAPGIASTAAFGTAAVTTRAAITAAGGIGSTAAFGTPTLSTGSVRSITDAGALASTAAFGVPTVTATTAGAASITNAGGIGSTAAFGIASLSPRLAIVVPGGIASGLTFGLPVVSLDGGGPATAYPLAGLTQPYPLAGLTQT
jgi:hypothetical protein